MHRAVDQVGARGTAGSADDCRHQTGSNMQSVSAWTNEAHVHVHGEGNEYVTYFLLLGEIFQLISTLATGRHFSSKLGENGL